MTDRIRRSLLPSLRQHCRNEMMMMTDRYVKIRIVVSVDSNASDMKVETAVSTQESSAIGAI